MKHLENKVALVTGAGSGIGLAAAELFSRKGAKVVISDISKKNGEAAVEKLNGMGGEALFVHADSSSPQDNEALV